MSPALQRVVATLVAVLVVVALAVVIMGLGDGDGDRDVAASPSAPPVATEAPGASPTTAPTAGAASPSADDAVATLREIEEEVAAIRGLERPDIGPPELITRAELMEELQRIFDEEYPPEERERDNIALRAMGLLGPDEDVAELQLQLLGDQVLGFYDDTEQRMVVVTEEGLDVEARITYAHEYTHALQDAAFGLDTLDTDAAGEDDRSLARTTLIEGDATVTMLAWAFNNLTQQQLQEYSLGAEVPDTTGIPSWMVAQLSFPYETGLAWVGQLAVNPLQPDFEAVDAAYADPPESTEQVMSLEAWNEREEPISVEVPDLASELGADWEEVDATPIGQASIEIILEHFGLPQAEAAVAAAGWGGDTSVVVAGPSDAFAMVWRLAWDTAEDAAEFRQAYEQVVAQLPFPAMVIDGGGDDEVLVVHASSADLMRRTIMAAQE